MIESTLWLVLGNGPLRRQCESLRVVSQKPQWVWVGIDLDFG
jgi:hypothetical protein